MLRITPFQIVSTLEVFFLAMLCYPDAQLTGHCELDAVIGSNRLVSFEDRSNLPYIEALCKEVLRWHPLGTTAFPHRLMQDDIVGEYFIPGGTMVFGHAWSVAYHH
jgi:cytochrome P450